MLWDNNPVLLFSHAVRVKFILSLPVAHPVCWLSLKGNDMTLEHTPKRTSKLLAGALAATMALTSFGATPAMAKPSEGVRVLQGLAALYIIGRAIEGSRSNTPRAVQPHVPSRHWGHQPRGRRVAPHRRASPPQKCFRTFRTRAGLVRGYASKCVAKNAPRLNLPQQCRTRISTNKGLRKVYHSSCLRRHGYRVANR